MLVVVNLVFASVLLGVGASPLQKKADDVKYSYQKYVRNGNFAPDDVDKLLDATWPKIEAWMAAKSGNNNCTLENAAVRREWSDLSVEEREDYTKAVLCLQKLPSKAINVPGSLSRFDDFVATHGTQAMMLHDPQHLFASHKYYIFAYEKALREECGYKGYQPYMNYERYADDPIHSAMFNGNASSMGGNGAPSTYGGVPMPFRPPFNKLPSAGGGGCVTEGPFKDMVVSLGPIGVIVSNIPKNPRADGLGVNRRCLRRDVNKYSAAGARANYTMNLITKNTDIDSFYNRYLGQPQLQNDPNPWGVHNAGHYIIGGDPGGDFYFSPGDPAFYFHHGMLDRIWWIWQMQDPTHRVHLVPGLGAQQMNHPNMPPMPRALKERQTGLEYLQKRQTTGKTAKDYVVDLGWTAPKVTLDKLNDQLGGNDGAFCYVYL